MQIIFRERQRKVLILSALLPSGNRYDFEIEATKVVIKFMCVRSKDTIKLHV